MQPPKLSLTLLCFVPVYIFSNTFTCASILAAITFHLLPEQKLASRYLRGHLGQYKGWELYGLTLPSVDGFFYLLNSKSFLMNSKSEIVVKYNTVPYCRYLWGAVITIKENCSCVYIIFFIPVSKIVLMCERFRVSMSSRSPENISTLLSMGRAKMIQGPHAP